MTTAKWIGWTLSILLVLFLIVASAGGKFVHWDGKEEMFQKMGYTVDVMFAIGVVEVIVALLYLIPPTAFVGAILTTAYLGGATSAHVRIGEPFYFPIAMGVLLWVSYGLRCPAVFRLARGQNPSETADGSPAAPPPSH